MPTARILGRSYSPYGAQIFFTCVVCNPEIAGPICSVDEKPPNRSSGGWPASQEPHPTTIWGAPSFRFLLAKGWDSTKLKIQIHPARALGGHPEPKPPGLVSGHEFTHAALANQPQRKIKYAASAALKPALPAFHHGRGNSRLGLMPLSRLHSIFIPRFQEQILGP